MTKTKTKPLTNREQAVVDEIAKAPEVLNASVDSRGGVPDVRNNARVRQVVRQEFGVTSSESIDMVIGTLANDRAVQEYVWTNKQVEDVQQELYRTAMVPDPSGTNPVKLKAGVALLDRVHGRAKDSVDVTSGGKPIHITIAPTIAQRYGHHEVIECDVVDGVDEGDVAEDSWFETGSEETIDYDDETGGTIDYDDDAAYEEYYHGNIT